MASLSKREQARNERELQDLLRLPGNSQCADCEARNPGWASWNLGVFLCVRCASIHRKLGTHISKVKSLSMDKWTSEQLESMKQQGNIASNKIYNPKNKKPDIPLDADEVDSAMERFIRKKYQEKSLVDGRPEPPSRVDISPSVTQTSQPSQTYDLPPTGKKHKFFGFSLRTSSKKDRPGAENAFKITPVEYSPTSGTAREVPDHELQVKLAQLRDMGFSDNERNLEVLKRSGGDLERTIATLVKLGPSEPRKTTPSPAPPNRLAEPSSSSSNNPFDQLDRRQPPQATGFGLSVDAPQPQAQAQSQPSSANPWQAAMHNQQPSGLEQQFSGLQVSNPLFPHHTGGYTGPSPYQNPQLQTMTPPPHSAMQQPYGYGLSPSTNASNPFYPQQQPMSSQSTGNNPFLPPQQSQPVFAPSPAANPFLGMQQSGSQAGVSNNNPFGLSPAQQSPQSYMQSSPAQNPANNPFGFPSQASPPPIQQSQTFPLTQQNSSFAYQQQQQQSPQSPQSQLPNFQYAQPQAQIPQAQFQSSPSSQPQSNFYQNQQFLSQTQQQPQVQQLQSQPTGRFTKNDIMALFSQPSQFQQQQLAPVQEAYDDQAQQYQQSQQPVSPAPTNNPYGAQSPFAGKRAATMPAPTSSMSTMHSSGGIGSRNPFLSAQSSTSTLSSAPTPFGQPQQQIQQPGYASQGWNQGARHVSNESVSVNNPALMEGRHSPDAFAVLSSRY